MKRYFARRSHELPGLNTAALPDLIFTVLFFFMIVTHMRSVEPKVNYQVPQGTQLQDVGHKSSVIYLYIGRSKAPQGSTDTPFCIQLNNRLVSIDDIKKHISTARDHMSPEDQARLTVSIKADRDVPMGIIADVKQALQQSFALRINYSATERAQKAPTARD